MQIDALKAYCTVYEEESFAKAARKLGISTPMMTRRIQQVESELDTELLYRSTRALTPTEAGELFYHQAKELIYQYDASILSLQTLSMEVSGTVKIGLPASISHLWVAPNLHHLTAEYPDLKFRLINGNHLLDLVSERFDVIIHCGKLPDSGFYSQAIRQWRKVTCASPNYLKTNGMPKHPDDLKNHNCLDHFDNLRNTWGFTIEGVEKPFFVKGNIKANSSMDLKNLAVSGHGVVYLPSFTVDQDIQDRKLKPILKKYEPRDYDMHVIYASKRHSNKKLRVVLDFLNEVLPR
jgi:LysR family transcriptional regulator, regulator for bpeEF and oprC